MNLQSHPSQVYVKENFHLYEFFYLNDITKNKISKLVEENNIDEIAILTWCHNENHRIKSYEIFANAFELSEKREPEKSTI